MQGSGRVRGSRSTERGRMVQVPRERAAEVAAEQPG